MYYIKKSQKLLTYLLVCESSHLFFLLWLPDFRPPPPLFKQLQHSPTLPRQSTAPALYYNPATLSTDLSQTHPVSLETSLASIIFPQIECLTALCHSVSLSAPSKKKNSASSLPSFFFLLLIGAGLNKEKLKGKGKMCFSVSALPSVSVSTS